MIYTLDEIRKKVVPIIRQDAEDLRRIIVFGSYARGTQDVNSDLDLYVDGRLKYRADESMDTEQKVSAALSIPVDLLTRPALENSVIREKLQRSIEQDGYLLYGEKTIARLEIIVGYADRIAQTHIRAGSEEGFLADYDMQYSVAHSISQIAETLTQIVTSNPELFEQLSAEVPYRDIRRMRDKIQHHYGSTDPDVVWGIAKHSVPTLREAVLSLITRASSDDAT